MLKEILAALLTHTLSLGTFFQFLGLIISHERDHILHHRDELVEFTVQLWDRASLTEARQTLLEVSDEQVVLDCLGLQVLDSLGHLLLDFVKLLFTDCLDENLQMLHHCLEVHRLALGHRLLLIQLTLHVSAVRLQLIKHLVTLLLDNNLSYELLARLQLAFTQVAIFDKADLTK